MHVGKTLRIVFTCIAGAMACASAPATGAGLFRAYLSVNGSDANPCTLPQPCRLLPAALAAAADGGEVWILDSGNFNTATVSVTKSVTITAIPGVVGSVVAIAGPAISVSTAAGPVSLSLNNLRITPLPGGGGTDGIAASGAGSIQLVLQGVTVQGHASHGVWVPVFGEVRVLNSIIRDNHLAGVSLSANSYGVITGSTFTGNGFGDNSGAIELTDASNEISSVTIFGNYSGVKLISNGADVFATIANSTITSGNYGVTVQAAGASGSARAVVMRSAIAENNVGLMVTGGAGNTAKLDVGYSSITGSATGMVNNGGTATLNSLGNNFAGQNTTNSAGTITTLTGI